MTLYKVAFTKGRERPRYTLLQRMHERILHFGRSNHCVQEVTVLKSEHKTIN